jgi:CBS domain-containing protein
MMVVAEILRRKGSAVYSISPDATVLEATQAMNSHRVGCLVVTQGGAMRGILTERDLLTRVLAVELDPRETLVRDVMTREIVVCGLDACVRELQVAMHERRIRHVPVKDEAGGLCGLISIGDLNAVRADELAGTVEALEMYIARG